MTAFPPPPIPSAPPAPEERVGRGLGFAALAIPGGGVGAAVVFSLIPGFPLWITALGGILVVSAAQWLYVKGAGVPPREGMPGVVIISIIAVMLTGFTGVVANVFAGFRAVGGRGGLLGEQFISTLALQIARDPVPFIVVLVLLAVGGLLGFVSRSAREARRRGHEAATGTAPSVVPPGAPLAAPAAAQAAPMPPVAAPPVAPEPVASAPASVVEPTVPPGAAAPVAPPVTPPANPGLPGVTMTQLPGAPSSPAAPPPPTDRGPAAG